MNNCHFKQKNTGHVYKLDLKSGLANELATAEFLFAVLYVCFDHECCFPHT